MPTISDAEGLGMYKEWSSSVNAYWTIFSAAVLGVLGIAVKSPLLLSGSTPGQPAIDWSRVILAIAFLFFAGGNLVAILNAQRLCLSLASALKAQALSPSDAAPNAYQAVFEAVVPIRLEYIRWFHILLSALTVVAILLAHSGASA